MPLGGPYVFPMREFVAEQYLPAGGIEAAARGVSAARAAAEQVTSEGTPVQFVGSIFIPEDETCLRLYRPDSIETVRSATARASLPLEQLAEARTWARTGMAE